MPETNRRLTTRSRQNRHQSRSPLDRTDLWREFDEQWSQQIGFPRAVRSDNPDLVAAFEDSHASSPADLRVNSLAEVALDGLVERFAKTG